MTNEELTKISPFEIAQMGKSGSLREALNAALKRIRDGEKDDEFLYIAATIAYELGDIQKAEQLVRLLLVSDPEQINGWLLFGRIYQRRGDMIRYGFCLNRAEEISPAIAELNLHVIARNAEMMSKQSQNGGSELNFETATYADICITQGYFNKALKIYSDLKEKDPGNPVYDLKIDEIRKKMGKHD
jgi:tetratricopeptide (TPR) repeat protein